MPNLGPVELLLILIVVLVVPIGIGYWCMVLFRSKGRSAGGGFAMGFALTFFFSILGAVVAVVIGYAVSSQTPSATAAWTPVAAPGSTGLPPAPPPPPTVIATFGSSTGWVGKAITYDHRGFVIDGVGAVAPAAVLSYADQGQIDWAHEGMRGWVAGLVPPAVTQPG